MRRLVLLGLLTLPAHAASLERADRIFVNGTIWTGEGAVCQALAIRGNRIIAVGTNAEVKKHAEHASEVVDLKGRLVVPGFNDAHVHFMSGCLGLDKADLSDAQTMAEIEKRIADFAKAHKDSLWVEGRGWVYGVFPGGLPHRKLLDRLVSDRPAFMIAYDGHTGWCNSLALLVAGVTRSTPNPGGGVIVRDTAGEPTGVLEEAAMGLVQERIPRALDEDKRRALRKGLTLAASYGLTSVQDARFDLDDLPVYERAIEEASLRLRFYSALPMEKDVSPEKLGRYKELRDQHGGPLFKFGAVKGIVDGVVESKTAAMLEPYPDGGTGLSNWTQEELNRSVAAYDREGFQVWLHAVGDRAIRMALDAFDHASKVNGTKGRRHRVEHVEVPQLAELSRFSPLGVIASTQALFANPDENTALYSQRLGPDRLSRALPFRLLDDAGAVQSFGSDWPVCSLDVLRGIYCAVTRLSPEGKPPGGWGPHLRISVESALRHFTRDGAYASFDEAVKGALAPGKLADLVVLSDNILLGPPERILKAKVLLTVLGGRDVYRAKEF